MSSSDPLNPVSPNSRITPQPDTTVLLEHQVKGNDDFARAAKDVFALLKAAQRDHPGALRKLVIRIEGHEGERAGFDADFFEFQQEFMLGALGSYFTWIEMPLTGSLGNPDRQQDADQDRLRVENPS